jgi:hypothetical protein
VLGEVKRNIKENNKSYEHDIYPFFLTLPLKSGLFPACHKSKGKAGIPRKK